MSCFTYVGDNLKKDFIAPNALGWLTVCLKDDGRNIHRQEVEDLEEGMRPKRWIEGLGAFSIAMRDTWVWN